MIPAAGGGAQEDGCRYQVCGTRPCTHPLHTPVLGGDNRVQRAGVVMETLLEMEENEKQEEEVME